MTDVELEGGIYSLGYLDDERVESVLLSTISHTITIITTNGKMLIISVSEDGKLEVGATDISDIADQLPN